MEDGANFGSGSAFGCRCGRYGKQNGRCRDDGRERQGKGFVHGEFGYGALGSGETVLAILLREAGIAILFLNARWLRNGIAFFKDITKMGMYTYLF